MIIFVVAHDKDRGIGFKGRVPWPRMQADREHLHALTKGKTIVMGERTYEEYKDVKQAFKTDRVIVVSRSIKHLDDAEVVSDLEEIIQRSKDEDLWVIGGGSIFKQLLPYASKMYLTEIEAEFEADTFFPPYDETRWKVLERLSQPADAENPYPYTFVTYEK